MFERNTLSTLYDLPLSTAPVKGAKAAVAIFTLSKRPRRRVCRAAVGRRRAYPRVAPRTPLTCFHAVHGQPPRVRLQTGARRSGELPRLRFVALLQFPASQALRSS